MVIKPFISFQSSSIFNKFESYQSQLDQLLERIKRSEDFLTKLTYFINNLSTLSASNPAISYNFDMSTGNRPLNNTSNHNTSSSFSFTQTKSTTSNSKQTNSLKNKRDSSNKRSSKPFVPKKKTISLSEPYNLSNINIPSNFFSLLKSQILSDTVKSIYYLSKNLPTFFFNIYRIVKYT